jgi:hypothetical protein
MATTDTTNTAAALNGLRSCRDGLPEIRLDAQTAALALTGARPPACRWSCPSTGTMASWWNLRRSVT